MGRDPSPQVIGRCIGNNPGELKVWDSHTGEEKVSPKGHNHAVRSVAFSCDGARVVSATTWEVKVWDVATGQERSRSSPHAQCEAWP